MRHQYHHATDIVPTILDVTGLEMPEVYRGVEQYPVNGVSMRYTFDDAEARTTKTRQYYAMLGTRGIWEDGWKAAALHTPISGVGHFDEDRMGALPRRRGPFGVQGPGRPAPGDAESADRRLVRGSRPNFVLPLDDRTPPELLAIEKPPSEPPRNRDSTSRHDAGPRGRRGRTSAAVRTRSSPT